MKNVRVFITLIFFYVGISSVASGQTKMLWQMGKLNDDPSEFALAPADAVCFVIGRSDPKLDWPSVHPTPDDNPFNTTNYRFTILFDIDKPISKGQCRFVVDLFKYDRRHPPKLRIDINGHTYIRRMATEGGVGSLPGSILPGVEFRYEIRFSADLLKAGQNQIDITTLHGSCMYYDWLGLETPDAMKLTAVAGQLEPLIPLSPLAEDEQRSQQWVEMLPALVRQNGQLCQPITAMIRHWGDPAEFTLEISGIEPATRKLGAGLHSLEALIPAVETKTEVAITLKRDGVLILNQPLTVKPVHRRELYFPSHPFALINFDGSLEEMNSKMSKRLEEMIKTGQTNTEVLWYVDNYLKQASPEKHQLLIDAVKKGSMELDALYTLVLTSLCRPEELVRLVDYANQLKKNYALPIETAMLDDVAGVTWGIVPVLAHSGVKYLSLGPYGWVRVGHLHRSWGDRPFYWVSPSGRHKILVWASRLGLSSGLVYRPQKGEQGVVCDLSSFKMTDHVTLLEYLRLLDESGYPYDIVHCRRISNSSKDVSLPDFISQWNARYVSPKLVRATSGDMFRKLERRHGDMIPAVQGDLTEFWSDNAGTAARESGLNRAAAERLVQAEVLWAMLDPDRYPSEAFNTAWRNVLFFDDCAWGGQRSVSHPDDPEIKRLWAEKQRYALDADAQSRKLVEDALSKHRAIPKDVSAIDVFNTTSWPRTDLVMLPKETELIGDVVKDSDGQVTPSQRLSTGELAFLAKDVPPLGAKRYSINAGKNCTSGQAKAQANQLSNGRITLKVDEVTGAIKSLTCENVGGYHFESKIFPEPEDEYWNGQFTKWQIQHADLVDRESGMGLNDYLYVPGNHVEDAVRNGPVNITVKENGPLLASLLIESDAPGCHTLSREVRVIDGLGRVDIINVADKQKIRAKEGVRFAFPFNVPESVMRMDIPFAVIRPDADQLAGANRNYIAVQRWVDISNQDFGITWATVDAPLVEVGKMRAPTSGGEFYIDVVPQFNKTIAPSQTLYSYVINNYWFTNTPADQEGLITFRYSLRPHARYEQGAAQRFGIERNQPLMAVPAGPETPVYASLLKVEPINVIVTALKPTDDGTSMMIRLFNASGAPEKVKLTWAKPKEIWLSNLTEENVSPISGPIDMLAYEIVTLLFNIDRN